MLKSPLLAVMCLLCLGGPAHAITLDSYQAKVAEAHRRAAGLETELRNAEVDHAGARELVEYIRGNFPASEAVEWDGGSAETSNEWLREKANTLEKATEIEKRLPVVVEMREYLSTIAFKLSELKAAVEAERRSKDEDKQKLGEILRRPEYQKPQPKEEGAIQKWVREFLDWLSKLWPEPNVPSNNLSSLEGLFFVMRIVFYAALIGLLVFLVYKIAPRLFPGLMPVRNTRSKKRVILGEQIGEDETAVDLFSEAERLAREGDLRAAIRKGYIALLCDLSDRKIIGLARHKTNRDYLRDVRSRRELHPRMKNATETFERNWYGSRDAGEQDWQRFREEYFDAVRSAEA